MRPLRLTTFGFWKPVLNSSCGLYIYLAKTVLFLISTWYKWCTGRNYMLSRIVMEEWHPYRTLHFVIKCSLFPCNWLVLSTTSPGMTSKRCACSIDRAIAKSMRRRLIFDIPVKTECPRLISILIHDIFFKNDVNISWVLEATRLLNPAGLSFRWNLCLWYPE